MIMGPRNNQTASDAFSSLAFLNFSIWSCVEEIEPGLFFICLHLRLPECLLILKFLYILISI